MNSHWYETFFSQLAIDFWQAAVPEEATVAEADFLVRALAVPPSAHLLDLPCGAGRHARALSQRGHRVTGVDLSPSALEAATAHGSGPTFLRGDMCAPVAGGPYDGAYCFGNSFGYLTFEATLGFIHNVREALRPGARWVLDIGVSAESLLPSLKEEVRTLEAGGVVFEAESRYDPLSGRLLQSCVLRRGAARERSEISYGVYTVAELHRLFSAQGFEVLGAFGALDERPFRLGDRRLLLVARRL